MVTVLIGRLKTAPKQAHLICFLFKTDCNTPIILIDITTSAVRLVTNGLNRILLSLTYFYNSQLGFFFWIKYQHSKQVKYKTCNIGYGE
jgi:hypothetical protein